MIVDKRTAIFLVLFFIVSCSAFSQLNRQWVARFSGNGKNGANAARAITADDSGNIYVTGWVTRTGTGVDIATIKYSPDGELMWAAYYPPSGAGTDKPSAIAVDTAHNVYVTGTTTTGRPNADYVTIKYNRTGDAVLWVKTYDGPGHGEDHPVAVAVNDSMNVYVSGWSMGAGTGYDYATIKYKPNGDSAWVRRYNGPAGGTDSALAMTLRGFTDLFVTGTSADSGYDYFTIKYSPVTGDSVWAARYNGYGFGNDIARGIVARTSSEVYVTGGSQNASGNYDFLTIRYDNGGVAHWVSRYTGPAGGDDQAYAISLGSSRVYVTGRSLQTGSFNDIVTVRYAQGSGAENWVSSYNGTANDDDGGLAVTAGTNPYVVGYSAGAGIGYDYALIKYNGSSGSEEFSLRYNGPANSDDIPAEVILVDNAVYVTGSSKKAKGSEFLTVKYIDPGSMKYRSFVQESLSVKAANLKKSAPNAGNVRDDAVLKAYPKIKKGYPGAPGTLVVGNMRPDSASVYGWMRFDNGRGVASYLPATGAARKFDFFGTSVFIGEKKNPKRDKHNNHLAGQLLALRINIGASDAEITPPTLGDLTYDDGDTANHYNGMTLRQIASLVDNCLTYGGRYSGVNWAMLDSMLTRTNRAFTGPLLRVVSTQPVTVTGAVLIDSVVFLKPAVSPLAEPLAFIPGSLDVVPEKFVLYQNYPNPFNPVTTISFDLPQASVVTLKVYDILGREVATLLEDQEVEEGTQEVAFDGTGQASGVYFYRITVDKGEFQQIRKMLLVK